MLKTPVLIPARNAPFVGETIAALGEAAWPIVVPNGCTDDTAAIAEGAGATIVPCEQEGKMPALQAGIRFLGDMALSAPLMTVDADTVPMFPKRFVPTMVQARQKLDPRSPALLVGPLRYVNGCSMASDAARTLLQAYGQYRSRFDPSTGRFGGSSMLFDMAGNQKLLDDILGLDNLWPYEDVALKDRVVENGGNTMKVMSARAFAATESKREESIFTRLRLGRVAALEARAASYLADAPPGSIPYASQS